MTSLLCSPVSQSATRHANGLPVTQHLPCFAPLQAFQYGNGNKTQELLAIADYYGAEPECVVLFDDSKFNERWVDLQQAGWRGVGGVGWMWES